MPPRNKRPISPEDLYRLQLITDCQLSPDGQHVVYAVQRIDRKTHKKFSNLWLAPTGRGRAWQFTHGDHVDSQPRWSPDGNTIAFLSNRRNEKQVQLYLIPFHGGEARPLTDLKGTFGAFAWSPDGKQIVCRFRKQDQDASEREADEQKKKLGVVARHITRIHHKVDGVGHLPKERWHIWIIDIRTGKAKQLTNGDMYEEWDPCWSPDGKTIAFCANRSEDPDLNMEAVNLFVMPSTGGDCRKLATPFGWKAQPRFSPDGRWLAYYGVEGQGLFGWKQIGLWVIAADGSGEAKNLTAPFDVTVADLTLNDQHGLFGLAVPPVWSRDGRRLYFPVTRHGNTVLNAVELEGDAASLQTIVGKKGVVGWFSFDQEQARLAYFHADLADPGQVWLREMATHRIRPLTRLNDNLLRTVDLGEIEEVWFKGQAGHDLHGWMLKPPSFDPAQTYPSILEIHGGPYFQYGNCFMHEFYYLAAHGYVVYFCNPRGSAGYGAAHAKAIKNNWGEPTYDDLMAWVDHVQQQPYIDQERMGVTGGSFGGYMTNWIIGHTQRFQAAVTQRSISNLISNYGSSDLNWWLHGEFGDEPPWANVEHYWQLSPLKYIANAKTPTLVIHSEQDLRCALEQGEQLFVALKRLGVETELVLFPDEPHGLSVGGRTDRRIERLHHIRRWFDRYLKKEELND